jgi:hypothetical protein
MVAQDNLVNGLKHSKLHQTGTVNHDRGQAIIKAMPIGRGQAHSRLLLIGAILLSRGPVLVRAAEQTKHDPAQLIVQTAGTTTGIHQLEPGLMEETVEILL